MFAWCVVSSSLFYLFLEKWEDELEYFNNNNNYINLVSEHNL